MFSHIFRLYHRVMASLRRDVFAITAEYDSILLLRVSLRMAELRGGKLFQ